MHLEYFKYTPVLTAIGNNVTYCAPLAAQAARDHLTAATFNSAVFCSGNLTTY